MLVSDIGDSRLATMSSPMSASERTGLPGKMTAALCGKPKKDMRDRSA